MQAVFNFRLTVILLFIQISLAINSNGQKHIDQQFNNWFNPSVNLKFHKYVGMYMEGQLRFNQFSHNMQHQVRSSLDIFVTDNLAISPIGYVYTWNYLYGKQPAKIAENEHRVYEQLSYKFKVDRVFFDNRVRMEQRWQEHKAKQTDGTYAVENYIYKNRFRYRFLMNVPINHKTMSEKTVFFSVWDEVFVSFGKNVTYKLPDQNRIYAGFGYKFNKYGTVQLGYLHQLIVKKDGMLNESNHTLFIGFNYLVDFTKMKKRSK